MKSLVISLSYIQSIQCNLNQNSHSLSGSPSKQVSHDQHLTHLHHRFNLFIYLVFNTVPRNISQGKLKSLRKLLVFMCGGGLYYTEEVLMVVQFLFICRPSCTSVRNSSEFLYHSQVLKAIEKIRRVCLLHCEMKHCSLRSFCFLGVFFGRLPDQWNRRKIFFNTTEHSIRQIIGIKHLD